MTVTDFRFILRPVLRFELIRQGHPAIRFNPAVPVPDTASVRALLVRRADVPNKYAVGLRNVSRRKATPVPQAERVGGRYANFCEIGYSAFEVLLELGQREVGIHTRIYLSPECARMLSETLLEAIGVHSVPTPHSVC